MSHTGIISEMSGSSMSMLLCRAWPLNAGASPIIHCILACQCIIQATICMSLRIRPLHSNINLLRTFGKARATLYKHGYSLNVPRPHYRNAFGRSIYSTKQCPTNRRHNKLFRPQLGSQISNGGCHRQSTAGTPPEVPAALPASANLLSWPRYAKQIPWQICTGTHLRRQSCRLCTPPLLGCLGTASLLEKCFSDRERLEFAGVIGMRSLCCQNVVSPACSTSACLLPAEGRPLQDSTGQNAAASMRITPWPTGSASAKSFRGCKDSKLPMHIRKARTPGESLQLVLKHEKLPSVLQLMQKSLQSLANQSHVCAATPVRTAWEV